jgi:WD40 repeat protein
MQGGYTNVLGLVVASETQIVLVASNTTTKQYKVIVVTVEENKLTIVWQGDGVGSDALCSPLHQNAYMAIIADGSDTIDVWSLKTKQLERQVKRRSVVWRRCCLLGENAEFILGVEGKKVVLWHTVDGRVLEQLEGHYNDVFGVAMNPKDPHEWISYGWDRSFIQWRSELPLAQHAHSLVPPPPYVADYEFQDQLVKE